MDTHHTARRSRPSRILVAALTIGLTVVTFAALALAGAVVTDRGLHRPVPDGPAPRASVPYSEPGASGDRLVVAFVVGHSGTIASDLLAPYDIFASSPAFTTYVVAADSAPAPLEGGPAVVPTFTFKDVDADPALRPDVVVVPGLTDPTGSTEAPLREWVARTHEDGARVLGVCSGAMVLADTGMLDGLDATSHWSRIKALQAGHPAVHWVRGQVYVEDGNVTTTAAVTSGIQGALHLVAELAGPDEAQRVADLHPELGWTPDASTTIPADHFALRDWPVGLNNLEPWFRPTVGISLIDGVGELDATAAFEVYSQSAGARTVAVATKDSVRTQHGLALLTTRSDDASHLSRLLVPGGGFTAALQDLADHTDAATALATAKMIGYPTTDLDLGTSHRPRRAVLLALISLLVAAGIGYTPALMIRRRRRRRHSPGVAVARIRASSPRPHASI
jgi:putative intracellular protease/amidase